MKASEYIKQNGDFEITKKIEKCITHKPKTVWDLEEGDDCYWLDGCNNITKYNWDNDLFCKEQRKIGLIALTAEELEFKIEKMKVYEELKRFAKEFTDEEFRYSREKYRIAYDFAHDYIYFPFNRDIKTYDLYFESEDKAREAITAVGEERVKKYYLGVGK